MWLVLECRLLYEKRFSIFHYPVMADEAPDYRDIVHNPMDVATLLENVDQGHYLTRAAFLQDVELIPANAKVSILPFKHMGCFRCFGPIL
jgi:hypothetical protein